MGVKPGKLNKKIKKIATRIKFIPKPRPIKHSNLLRFSVNSFQKLVCKSDQLIKRRAKSGLITVNSNWGEVKGFVQKFINKEFTV